MAKPSKPNDSEFKTIWYGINPKTLEVESVWETYDGALRGRNDHIHRAPGRNPIREIALVWRSHNRAVAFRCELSDQTAFS